MDREYLWVLVPLLLMFAFFGSLIYVVYDELTDPVKIAVQKQRDYDFNYPCINGVRYIRVSRGITPMIDPATMQPQLCGAESGK